MVCIPGLDSTDIVIFQSISRRFLTLGRDVSLWRTLCFERSNAKTRRGFLSRLQEGGKGGGRAGAQGWVKGKAENEGDYERGGRAMREGANSRVRALINWDPSYPSEDIDFYDEYIRRHAPISTLWFQDATTAAGMGILYGGDENSIAQKVVAPLEDGSVCMWECGNSKPSHGSESSDENSTKQGEMVAKSLPGILFAPGDSGSSGNKEQQIRSAMTDTSAAELVSIDSVRMRGYFAVQNTISEVDLATLQLISRHEYPFQVMVLSEAKVPVPITIGTSKTLHLLDIRCRNVKESSLLSISDTETTITNTFTTRTTGMKSLSPVTNLLELDSSRGILPTADPLSIVHLYRSVDNQYDNNDIWVAGRFASLLKYDRRFFPRFSESIYSGASLSSICALPYPLIPSNMNLVENPSIPISALQRARSMSGQTLVAVGEYKLKGSLELYGIKPSSTNNELSMGTSGSDSGGIGDGEGNYAIRNRITASSSKLLSVTAHSACIACSDGSGYIRWMERDAFMPIRKYEINLARSGFCSNDDDYDHHYYPNGHTYEQGYSNHSVEGAGEEEWPNLQQRQSERAEGDIVRRLLPTRQFRSSSSSSSHIDPSQLNQNNLVIWTGEGHIGLVGFGKSRRWNGVDFCDSNNNLRNGSLDDQVKSAEEEAKFRKERMYDITMRRALERQADEVSFMRGLGLGI